MSIDEYIAIMRFPPEWKSWNMLPASEVMEKLIASYKLGMERASEHDRNGCFHYWLHQNPDDQTLATLAKLARLDPDQLMGSDVIEYIKRSPNFGPESRKVVRCGAT